MQLRDDSLLLLHSRSPIASTPTAAVTPSLRLLNAARGSGRASAASSHGRGWRAVPSSWSRAYCGLEAGPRHHFGWTQNGTHNGYY